MKSEITFNQLVGRLKSLADEHPEYGPFAYIKIFDDGSGSVFYEDEDGEECYIMELEEFLQ